MLAQHEKATTGTFRALVPVQSALGSFPAFAVSISVVLNYGCGFLFMPPINQADPNQQDAGQADPNQQDAGTAGADDFATQVAIWSNTYANGGAYTLFPGIVVAVSNNSSGQLIQITKDDILFSSVLLTGTTTDTYEYNSITGNAEYVQRTYWSADHATFTEINMWSDNSGVSFDREQVLVEDYSSGTANWTVSHFVPVSGGGPSIQVIDQRSTDTIGFYHASKSLPPKVHRESNIHASGALTRTCGISGGPLPDLPNVYSDGTCSDDELHIIDAAFRHMLLDASANCLCMVAPTVCARIAEDLATHQPTTESPPIVVSCGALGTFPNGTVELGNEGTCFRSGIPFWGDKITFDTSHIEATGTSFADVVEHELFHAVNFGDTPGHNETGNTNPNDPIYACVNFCGCKTADVSKSNYACAACTGYWHPEAKKECGVDINTTTSNQCPQSVVGPTLFGTDLFQTCESECYGGDESLCEELGGSTSQCGCQTTDNGYDWSVWCGYDCIPPDINPAACPYYPYDVAGFVYCAGDASPDSIQTTSCGVVVKNYCDGSNMTLPEGTVGEGGRFQAYECSTQCTGGASNIGVRTLWPCDPCHTSGIASSIYGDCSRGTPAFDTMVANPQEIPKGMQNCWPDGTLVYPFTYSQCTNVNACTYFQKGEGVPVDAPVPCPQ